MLQIITKSAIQLCLAMKATKWLKIAHLYFLSANFLLKNLGHTRTKMFAADSQLLLTCHELETSFGNSNLAVFLVNWHSQLPDNKV